LQQQSIDSEIKQKICNNSQEKPEKIIVRPKVFLTYQRQRKKNKAANNDVKF